MKYLKILVGVLGLATLAATPPTSSELAYLSNQNLLKNPGFELGKTGWTASGGTFTITTTASQVGSGARSGSWDSNGAAQTLTSDAIVIPAGWYGKNGVVSCQFKTASGTATHTLNAYDGTNILSSASITSDTTFYPRNSTNFIFPSSGSIYLRLASVASDEPTIYIDNCIVGLADGINLQDISQATTSLQLTWSGSQATNHNTNTKLTFSSATVETNTSFTISTGTFTATQPGKYDITFGVRQTYVNDASTERQHIASIFKNGSQVSQSGEAPGIAGNSINSGTVGLEWPTTEVNDTITLNTGDYLEFYYFTTNSAGTNRTIESARVKIKRFPTSSEQAYRPDLQSAYAASVWSSITNCIFVATGGVMTDSDCGNPTTKYGKAENPGTANTLALKVSNLPVGLYRVSLDGGLIVTYSGSTTNCTFTLSDGSTTIASKNWIAESGITTVPGGGLSGVVNYSSIQSSKEFTVSATRASGSGTCALDVRSLTASMTLIPLSQSIPVPLLVGSVTSGNTGALRMEAVTFGGASATTVCSTNPCTYYNSTYPGWITIGQSGTGVYAITYPTGTFSSTPVCTVTPSKTAGLDNMPNYESFDNVSAAIRNVDRTNAATNLAGHVICIGPR